jgi:serine/threonine-protein phosphatase 6 regulatory subunit 3
MALLNRSASYDRLYDSEGRLQGGLSAMEALAQVIAMSNETQRDDAMDESDDEFEPPEQLPVSNPDRSHSSIDDSDEDMSSDGGNLDEDMDDIAIDDTPFPVSAAPSGESPPQTRSGAPTPSPPSVSPSPSPAPVPIRKNSGSVSPMDSPVVRPRSSRSTRSFRRNSRRTSVITELPSIGELLKRKMLDESILSDIMVRVNR